MTYDNASFLLLFHAVASRTFPSCWFVVSYRPHTRVVAARMGYVDRHLNAERITLLSFSCHRGIPLIPNKFVSEDSGNCCA